MLKKNDLIKQGSVLIRILDISNDQALIVRSDSRALPRKEPLDSLSGYEVCSQAELRLQTYESMSGAQRKIVHERFSMIAPLISMTLSKADRSSLLFKIAQENGISSQTIKIYLHDYLLSQDICSLAPHPKDVSRPLSADEKNIRWALNKWFYSWEKQTIQTTYEKMLRAKYCDENGQLIKDHPTIHQFRYFYRKTKKMEKYYITRDGYKSYQRDHRPLLGDGVQQYSPVIGDGMIDATICDIYLVNKESQLVGRPILVTCVDAHSGLCCGYSLLWEGGVYSLRNLMQNIITDKVEWCRQFGIEISDKEWPCYMLPGRFLTDMGTEFTSGTFEQITDLGVTLINLGSYRPDLKGPVEKLFDLIQTTYKKNLKGKGVIEPDFRERGAHDYRKDACLTMDDFEKIVIRCILYHNNHQILDNYPFTEDMLRNTVKPYASDIWNWCQSHKLSNFITVSQRNLILTLLPRTRGTFNRSGLHVNKMRYYHEGYTERYLNGGSVIVAYNPDNVSTVWIIEDNQYIAFSLIERRYASRALSQVNDLKAKQAELIKSEAENNLQAKIRLANHIEAIADTAEASSQQPVTKDIRKTRKKERQKCHQNIFGDSEE